MLSTRGLRAVYRLLARCAPFALVYAPCALCVRSVSAPCTRRVRFVCAPCTLLFTSGFVLFTSGFVRFISGFPAVYIRVTCGLHQGYLRFASGLLAVYTRPACVGCSWVWALAVITRGRLSLVASCYRGALLVRRFFPPTAMTARFREAVAVDGTRRASGCPPAWASSEAMTSGYSRGTDPPHPADASRLRLGLNA